MRKRYYAADVYNFATLVYHLPWFVADGGVGLAKDHAVHCAHADTGFPKAGLTAKLTPVGPKDPGTDRVIHLRQSDITA
jgi:hypothetical protein